MYALAEAPGLVTTRLAPLVPRPPGAPRPTRQRVTVAAPAVALAPLAPEPLPGPAPTTPRLDPAAACADGLLDRRAAAKFLGIGVSTLRAVVEPEIPVVRVGRRVLLPRAALAAFAAARLRRPLREKSVAGA